MHSVSTDFRKLITKFLFPSSDIPSKNSRCFFLILDWSLKINDKYLSSRMFWNPGSDRQNIKECVGVKMWGKKGIIKRCWKRSEANIRRRRHVNFWLAANYACRRIKSSSLYSSVPVTDQYIRCLCVYIYICLHVDRRCWLH